MRKRTRKNHVTPRTGGMTRRSFLEATAAGVALPWVIVPVGTQGAGVADALAAGDALAQGFRTPPDSAKPWCYWWWLDSNAAKEGITADLEAMKRQGIVGALVIDAGKGTESPNDDYRPRIRGGNDFDSVHGIGSPIGPLFMGHEWRELFKYAVKEANRLGIQISFNITSGWDCGGTWVTPEHATKRLTWSKTLVQGPREFSRELPQPDSTDGYYKDVAVVAFPLPETSLLAMDKAEATFTGSSTANRQFLALRFPEPFAAASLYIVPNRFCVSKGNELQVSEDGKTYRTVAKFDLEPLKAETVAFEAVKARYYRIPLQPHTGWYTAALLMWTRTGGQQSPWLLPIDDIQILQRGEAPRLAAPSGVRSHSAVKLTQKMDSAGKLCWSVPAGNWALFRFGQTLYDGEHERKTKLTSPGAEGYEIDIMSAEALDVQIAGTVEKLASDVGPLAGKTWKYLHIDSWEAGEPNWTTGMATEFEQRRGYDPIPYLAALTCTTVDSREVTLRFARDLRRTVADLWAEKQLGRLHEQARRFGMGVHSETGEGFPVSVMDSFMNWGQNDIPMGEFWIQDNPFNSTVKNAASAAHGYGKPICQAEAFTSLNRPNWEEDPWLLKKWVDPQFCAGLNRSVLCYYTHQPYLDIKPGYQFQDSGTHFDRNITWWDQSRAFFDYLSRCQFLLQQGRFVADVCYFAGEDAPTYSEVVQKAWRNAPRSMYRTAIPAHLQVAEKVPAGYDNDSINGEVLMTRLSVKDGCLVLPDGMSYRVLVLPDNPSLTPEALQTVAALVQAGATVVGSRPTRSPSLKGFPGCDQQVKELADKVWGPPPEGEQAAASEHAYGKGRVIWGKKVAEVLSSQGIMPDFACAGADLDYIHRSAGGSDIYFVSNNYENAAKASCTFRVSGRQPELWDPLECRIRDAVAFTQEADHRTTVPLELGPRGSVFVVFRKPIAVAKNGASTGNFAAYSRVMELAGPWTVKFDPKWGGPESVEFTELVDWTKRSEDGIKYYSGKATYVKAFDWSAPSGSKMCLNLGELNNVAEVRLNGQNLGVLWAKPFRCEINGALKNGRNDLEIDVVNLWPNRLIGDAHLPPEKWFCKTNVREFTKDYPLLPSGLLGPVLVESA